MKKFLNLMLTSMLICSMTPSTTLPWGKYDDPDNPETTKSTGDRDRLTRENKDQQYLDETRRKTPNVRPTRSATRNQSTERTPLLSAKPDARVSFEAKNNQNLELLQKNEVYTHLLNSLETADAREAFEKNVEFLSTGKSSEFEDSMMQDQILKTAYDDAQKLEPKTEPSLKTKLWNAAKRFWSKHGFGKTEADYVKTVVKQALHGDATSIRLLTKQEIESSFKPLDVPEKKNILETMQVEANKIYKNMLNDEATRTTRLMESNLDAEELAQATKSQSAKFTKQEKAVTSTITELVQSLNPMLDPGQKIISTWDREPRTLIINLVDLSEFTYNLEEDLQENVNRLIQEQKLTVPTFESRATDFRNLLEKELNPLLQQSVREYTILHPKP